MDIIPYFLTGLATLCGAIILDRVNFIHKNTDRKTIYKEAPYIKIMKASPFLSAEQIIQESHLYTAELKIYINKEQSGFQEKGNLVFSRLLLTDPIECDDKYFILIQNNGIAPCEINSFSYPDREDPEVLQFQNHFLKKDEGVTLVFLMKDKPSKLRINFQGCILEYNLLDDLSGIIYPYNFCHKKVKRYSKHKQQNKN